MVEQQLHLDLTFGSLSNVTRRDMLQRVTDRELSVTELFDEYKRHLTFAAVSKHVSVLENAGLITKEKRGKLHLVRLAPKALIPAVDYLQQYKEVWEDRLDALEAYLKTME